MVAGRLWRAMRVGALMAKAPTRMPATKAATLTARERALVFCAASGADWQHSGVPGVTITAMMVTDAYPYPDLGILLIGAEHLASVRAHDAAIAVFA
jgi:hypothetical protein